MRDSHIGAALAVMTGAGALLGGAGFAEAAPLAFSLNTNSTTSQNLTFNQFDASLGTLTEVDITLSNSATGGTALASITGGEGGQGNFATADLSGSLKITGPGAATIFSAATSVFAHCEVPPPNTNHNCSNGPNAQTNPSLLPNPAAVNSGLAAYIGLGTFDLTAAIADLVNNNAFNASHPIGGGSGTTTDNLTWTGELSVTFQFTPAEAAIPEPAGLMLLGGGMSALGLARRRRNRQSTIASD